MARKPKKFMFSLMPHEVSVLTAPVGAGGHQSVHQVLTDQLANGNKITLDDTQLGAVIRCMTQYKSGGFQGRLRKAMLRPILFQLMKG